VDQIQLITQEMFVLLGITAQKVVQQRNLLPVLQELFRPQQD
jgi:uracil-DNA glycosylase